MNDAMNDAMNDQVLLEPLEDRRLSRAERKALRAVVADAALDKRALERFRPRAFAAADAACKGDRPSGDVLEWLEDTIRALVPSQRGNELRADSDFSPGEHCLRSIVSCIRNARSSSDVYVFTLTDDRISDELG